METEIEIVKEIEWGVWVPAIISVISLIVTTFFSIFISPIISSKHEQKIAMYKICSELFDFLSQIPSKNNEELKGALSTIRSLSLKIDLMFKSGTAPDPIPRLLEDVFQLVKELKSIVDDTEKKSTWHEKYRNKLRELRQALAKYVGVLK